jgi:hypothetical protein
MGGDFRENRKLFTPLKKIFEAFQPGAMNLKMKSEQG